MADETLERKEVVDLLGGAPLDKYSTNDVIDKIAKHPDHFGEDILRQQADLQKVEAGIFANAQALNQVPKLSPEEFRQLSIIAEPNAVFALNHDTNDYRRDALKKEHELIVGQIANDWANFQAKEQHESSGYLTAGEVPAPIPHSSSHAKHAAHPKPHGLADHVKLPETSGIVINITNVDHNDLQSSKGQGVNAKPIEQTSGIPR